MYYILHAPSFIKTIFKYINVMFTNYDLANYFILL